MSHKSERELIAKGRNLARYCTENRSVSWVLFAVVLLLGVAAYIRMPKCKDPFIKVRVAVAVAIWPGASPEKIEELVTRRIEEKISQNADVERVESTSRAGVSVSTIYLRDNLPPGEVGKTFDDIDLRLRSIRDLPQGTLPIEFQKDFGDTAALMLTVASPPARAPEIALRARAIADALTAERRTHPGARSAIVLSLPLQLNLDRGRRAVRTLITYATAGGRVRDAELVEGTGFLAIDATVDTPGTWMSVADGFLKDRMSSTIHPEAWSPIVVDDVTKIEAKLAADPGAAYSYRELDEYTEKIAQRLRGLPTVSKVQRVGTLNERIFLDFSQERLAALGIGPNALAEALAARNAPAGGGSVDALGRVVNIEATSEIRSEADIENTPLATTASGGAVYVRDLVDVTRDYESPPSFLNYVTARDASGRFHRLRAVTLATQMRVGEQVARFSTEVDGALDELRQTLPEDIVTIRTSDQARQVEEKVGLFMTSLYEAIAIIVVMGLVGFREWRSALVLAISIPLTLAMTFVFMAMLKIDIQQISLAALILALGLLVDDPVVAGDSIKHELDRGKPRVIAAWLGPTKLARAILYATITNIAAYLPFLLFNGDVGNFIYSLPIVMACSLVASRIVSMTFIPLLGYALLRPKEKRENEELSPAMARYRRFVARAIDHRYRVVAASVVVLVAGGFAASRLKMSFFPKDFSHILYVDVFLPEDSSLRMTNQVAVEAEKVIAEVAEDYGRKHGKHGHVLGSISAFVGAGAPRFWYSLSPQPRQLNYAQLVLDVEDEHDTENLIAPLQAALTSRVPGAQMDVRQLENGKPVPQPIELRFIGDDPATLRAVAAKAKDALRGVDIAERVRDDWGENSFRVNVDVDAARAGFSGVSNADVANAAAAGFGGAFLNTLHDGDKLVPIVARLRYGERGSASDIDDLYVFAGRGEKVTLAQVAQVDYKYGLSKIQRRNQRRTITVSCLPAFGRLPSEVMSIVKPKLKQIQAELPPGYSMEIGGTHENVVKVVGDAAVVAIVSLGGILLTLVLQLKSALKPLLVFAAIPYGVCGALIALAAAKLPFGFTAILGVISLIGVIVSHVIVLFDYIEEAREEGVSLEQALLDASTQRLRPVLITVGATVFGLIPLAVHGGPLWEPLCYAQIGGLTLATAITLVLVPTLYAVFARDLKWIAWVPDAAGAHTEHGEPMVLEVITNPGVAASFESAKTRVMAPRGFRESLRVIAGGKRRTG